MRAMTTSSMMATFLLAGCGAQSRSPNSVDLTAKDLGPKAREICTGMRQYLGDLGSNTSNLSVDRCAQAGQAAFDLGKANIADSFQYSATPRTEGSDKLLNISTRVEFWLNSNIVGLVQKFSGSLQQKNRATIETIGSHETTEKPMGGDSNLVNTKFTITKPIEFDSQKLSFSIEAKIELTGAVTVNNTLFASGKLFESGIGVMLDSRTETPASVSLIKRVNAFVLIIPHANDIYVDTFLEADLHSYGVDSVMDRIIRSALGSGLASVAKLIPKITQGEK